MKKIIRLLILFSIMIVLLCLPPFTLTASAAYEDNYLNGVYGKPIYDYISENPDGTLTLCSANQEIDGSTLACNIEVSKYDRDFSLLSTKYLERELPYFGGVFFGEKYNFIAFGEYNGKEERNKEVIRIVKYDKEFNRLDSASIYSGEFNVQMPFDTGCPRFAEDGSTLILYTSKIMFLSEDGKRHQRNLLVKLNTETMNVSGFSEYPWVSHSFNQFVLFDNGSPVYLDHGDGYPRAVVLNKVQKSSTIPVELYSIPGESGYNETGVCVGGFEMSDSSYLVSLNSLDFTEGVEDWDQIYEKLRDEKCRDVLLCALPRNSTDSSDVRTITIAKYTGTGTEIEASMPYLVKLNDDRFAILWQEVMNLTDTEGTMYVIVDGEGNVIQPKKLLPNTLISRCVPVLDFEGNLIWFDDHDDDFGWNAMTYVPLDTGDDARDFYRVNLDTGNVEVYTNKALTASPISSMVTVNGSVISFEAYNIKGSNYFKLRDLAYVLNSTNKQFSVEWDSRWNRVLVTSGAPYTYVGGELAKKSRSEKTPIPAAGYLMVDNEEKEMAVYNIDGNNYFRLRDIGKVLDFGVDWDSAENTIIIETSKSYKPE